MVPMIGASQRRLNPVPVYRCSAAGLIELALRHSGVEGMHSITQAMPSPSYSADERRRPSGVDRHGARRLRPPRPMRNLARRADWAVTGLHFAPFDRIKEILMIVIIAVFCISITSMDLPNKLFN
jgi:hypothetical protein